jgi:hypothetical protein
MPDTFTITNWPNSWPRSLSNTTSPETVRFGPTWATILSKSGQITSDSRKATRAPVCNLTVDKGLLRDTSAATSVTPCTWQARCQHAATWYISRPSRNPLKEGHLEALLQRRGLPGAGVTPRKSERTCQTYENSCTLEGPDWWLVWSTSPSTRRREKAKQGQERSHIT